VINRIAPVGLMLAIACHGSDGIAPNPVSSDISSMAVGEVRTFRPADLQNGIDLPPQSSVRDYVIIVGNTSPQHDVVANYVVRADRSPGPTFGISAPSDLGAQSTMIVGSQLPLARTPQQALENTVRAFERRNLVLHSPSDPLGVSRFSLRRSILAGAVAVPAVGDRLNLKIPDAAATNLCTNYFPTQAVVASVSNRAILAVDTLDGPPALLFTPAQMDSITTEFDNITYPTDASYFGNPTDIDGNARVIILFTGQVNKLTPPNTPAGTGFTAGFFFAGDFFPPTGTTPNTFCAQSNQAEIFYLLAPDPTGRFGNIRTTSSVRQGTRGTIAHEFQHMINAGNRFQNPAVGDFEQTWLDEALAHFGEDAVGRRQRSFTDLQTLTYNDILPCAPCSEADDFNAFFFPNLARLTLWMDKPNLYSPTSALADTSLATRGAAWALVRYAADNYSSEDPRAFTRKLVAGPDTGVTNFSAAAATPIETLLSGWLVSMYADHLGISGLNPNYQYRSWNFRSVMPPVAKAVLNQTAPNGTYPLVVQSISGSVNLAGTNRSGSGTYYRLNVPANSGAKNVKVLDASGNVASFAGEQVYVLRVQ
jgi:hypothetical protein